MCIAYGWFCEWRCRKCIQLAPANYDHWYMFMTICKFIYVGYYINACATHAIANTCPRQYDRPCDSVPVTTALFLKPSTQSNYNQSNNDSRSEALFLYFPNLMIIDIEMPKGRLQKVPEGSRSLQKPPEASRSLQKPPKASRSFQKLPETSRSLKTSRSLRFQKPPEAFRSLQKPPEASRSPQKPP